MCARVVSFNLLTSALGLSVGLSFVNGKRTIKYKCTKLWNTLTDDIKETKSLQSFKYNLKKLLVVLGLIRMFVYYIHRIYSM